MKKKIILLAVIVFVSLSMIAQDEVINGKLTVNGTLTSDNFLSNPSNTNYHHFIRDGYGAAVYINQVSTDSDYPILRLSSGSSNPNEGVKFTVENNGSVGLGTNTNLDNYKFSIKQSSSSSGYGFRLLNQNSSRSVQLWVGTVGAVLDAEGSTDLHFRTSGTDRMYISNGGQVGIGTTTMGSHLLAVEGSIGAREINCEATGWSDFVFENDYELLTLEEVEKHINQNGHLPEIPSEAEVTENGINLGEMDAKLLQKIEELTLYMIDVNKRVNQLENENSRLKNEISKLANNLEQP